MYISKSIEDKTSNIYDSYRAVNGFGAIINVDKYRTYRYKLSFQSSNILSNNIVIYKSLTKAKLLKDKTKIKFIFSPNLYNNLYYKENTKFVKPTFDYPYDEIIYEHIFYSNLKAIIIYNNKTKEIIYSYLPEFDE